MCCGEHFLHRARSRNNHLRRRHHSQKKQKKKKNRQKTNSITRIFDGRNNDSLFNIISIGFANVGSRVQTSKNEEKKYHSVAGFFEQTHYI